MQEESKATVKCPPVNLQSSSNLQLNDDSQPEAVSLYFKSFLVLPSQISGLLLETPLTADINSTQL